MGGRGGGVAEGGKRMKCGKIDGSSCNYLGGGGDNNTIFRYIQICKTQLHFIFDN